MTQQPRDSAPHLTPWYKQFWPWFVIALPASAVFAGITTVIIANKHADSLVVDDYYKQGLAINVVHSKLEQAKTLGLKATVQRLKDDRLVIRFSGNQPQAQNLLLKFVHPGEARRDFDVSLTLQTDGSYQAKAPQSTSGRWYLQLTNNRDWLLKTELGVDANDVNF